MNHPEREEWVPYVFGEANPVQRRRLDEHLSNCASCRDEVDTWRRSLRRLDAWRLPSPPKPALAFAPLLRWAAAAAIVLVLGVAIGRSSASRLDAKAVQEVIGPALQQETKAMNQRMDDAIAALVANLESRRAEDHKTILAMFEKMESQHASDVLALKKDLDTVAVNTDAGLRQTEEQLIQLADYRQPKATQ